MAETMAEKYLRIVGKGFTFNPDSDLEMVSESNKFVDSLSIEDTVDLIEGLDSVLRGNLRKGGN